MSKQSRQFKVPDELTNLYDFANSLDIRHFTHHGVPHEQDDELKGPRELGDWMSKRELLASGGKITPAMFETALQLRASIRAYLACDQPERRKNRDAARSLNRAMRLFPLVPEARNDHGIVLRAAREDALVHVHAVRESNEDPDLSRAPSRHWLV